MLDFHPISNIFPLMTDTEFDALVSDISEHGQHEPIWLYEGKILDGRNRARACDVLGIVPEFREYTGDDPQSFVVSLNLHRRHLTREQRNEVIRGLRANGMTLQRIADAVGVSVDTAHRVARDAVISEIGIENARGQHRPMNYAARAVEVAEDEPEEKNGCFNCKYHHYNRSAGNEFCALLGVEFDMSVCPCDMRSWTEEGSEPELAPVPANGKPHVAQNSGENEWYTPAEYIKAARAVMGRIDLDPASTEVANSVVGASKFYTKEDDGLLYDWHGKVWMNPPYSQPHINQFVNRLRQEYEGGRVTEAVVLVNNATETTWFHNLVLSACAVCFPLARVRFWAPDRRVAAPLQGQAVVYLGPQPDKFIEEFRRFGWCAEVTE